MRERKVRRRRHKAVMCSCSISFFLNRHHCISPLKRLQITRPRPHTQTRARARVRVCTSSRSACVFLGKEEQQLLTSVRRPRVYRANKRYRRVVDVETIVRGGGGGGSG